MKVDKKGGVLIYVLGMIAVLSLVVTEFLRETTQEVVYKKQMRDQEDLHVVAFSFFQLALGALWNIYERDKGLFAPEQGWNKPLDTVDLPLNPDYAVSITFQDETGKLSLYQIPEQVGSLFLKESTLNAFEAERFRNALHAFLEKEPKKYVQPLLGSKRGAQERLSIPGTEETSRPAVLTKNSPWKRTVNTLWDLMEDPGLSAFFLDEAGQPTAFFKEVLQYVTVYYDGKININTAEPFLRAFLFEAKGEDGQTFYRSMDELALSSDVLVNDLGIGFEVRVLKATVQVFRGPILYKMEFYLQVEPFNEANKGNVSPFKILAFKHPYASVN